jgi:Na+/H+ antiporter NhaA
MRPGTLARRRTHRSEESVHRDLLAAAATSPVTWRIVIAYVVAKPPGIAATAAAGAGRRAPSRCAPGQLGGAALSAGVGFTVALLIAARAFDGLLLDEAKVGFPATAILAPALAIAALARRRQRAGAARPRAAAVATSPCGPR